MRYALLFSSLGTETEVMYPESHSWYWDGGRLAPASMLLAATHQCYLWKITAGKDPRKHLICLPHRVETECTNTQKFTLNFNILNYWLAQCAFYLHLMVVKFSVFLRNQFRIPFPCPDGQRQFKRTTICGSPVCESQGCKPKHVSLQGTIAPSRTYKNQN